MKSIVTLIIGVIVVLGIQSRAQARGACAASRIPHFRTSEGVYPAQVLKEHQMKGQEALAISHDGPGFCYGAEKGIFADEVKAFEYERLGLGRGEAYEAYLLKDGERHAVFLGDQSLPRTEGQCEVTMSRSRSVAISGIAEAAINEYDPVRKLYIFRSSYSPLPAEEREIRLINNGKDLTLHFVKDLNRKHIVCIFPRQ